MDDTSTTDVDNSAGATTDPITSTDTGTADTSDNSTSSQSTDIVASDTTTDATNTNDDSASTFDSDLDEWIEKRGLTAADSDEQKQAYQDLRNNQREFTREQQAKRAAEDAKSLGDEIHKLKPEASQDDDDDMDPLEKDVKSLKDSLQEERNTRLQSEFFTTNKVTPEETKVLMDVLKEKLTKPTTPEAKQAAFDYWSKPDALNDLLDIAKARILNSSDTSAVAQEAARKEREKIAKESQASSPGRGAKTVNTGTNTPEEDRLARFSTWE